MVLATVEPQESEKLKKAVAVWEEKVQERSANPWSNFFRKATAFSSFLKEGSLCDLGGGFHCVMGMHRVQRAHKKPWKSWFLFPSRACLHMSSS